MQVQHTEQRTGHQAITLAEISGGADRDRDRDNREMGAVDLTQAEKEDILDMRNTPHLYNKVSL